MPPMLPKARKKDLVIQKLDDEVLVYDLRTDRAHCLNPTAALVWRYCDGKTDLLRIAKKLSTATGEPAGEAVVQLALQRLQKVHLLDETGPRRKSDEISRRELIRRVGKAAAVTLPLVTSIVAPEAIQAASCVVSTNCLKGRTQFDKRCCCTNGKSLTSCDAAKGSCVAAKSCS